MSLVKVQGVVLKNINLGESDKIITIFTDKLGKIDAAAHGARKPKSKLMASTQPFCYAEYILYSGKNLYTISQSSIIESFQSLLMDLDKLAYGSYFLELIDSLNEKEEKNVSMLALLLKIFYILTNDDVDLELLKLTVDFKAISLSGYMPQISYCTRCKSKIYDKAYFDIGDGGLKCINCGNINKDYEISQPVIQFLHILKNIKLENLRDIKYDKKVVEILSRIISDYIKFYTLRDYQSMKLIRKLK